MGAQEMAASLNRDPAKERGREKEEIQRAEKRKDTRVFSFNFLNRLLGDGILPILQMRKQR